MDEEILSYIDKHAIVILNVIWLTVPAYTYTKRALIYVDKVPKE